MHSAIAEPMSLTAGSWTNSLRIISIFERGSGLHPDTIISTQSLRSHKI